MSTSSQSSAKPRSRAKAAKVTTPPVVPSLHLVMIAVTGGLTIFSGIAYFFAPPGKEQVFAQAMTLCLGFVTGKLSNSFGKKIDGTDKDEPKADGDDSE
jgi:hypothetical protein